MLSLINDLFNIYPENGSFVLPNGPVESAPQSMNAQTEEVPNSVGLYFIYSPSLAVPNGNALNCILNGNEYALIYIGKAGMNNQGEIGTQGIRGRLRNVGANDIRRSVIWRQLMTAEGWDHLLFRWVVTRRQDEVLFDNCFRLEKSFYKLWEAIPIWKPLLND
jgi:hypothetical protein